MKAQNCTKRKYTEELQKFIEGRHRIVKKRQGTEQRERHIKFSKKARTKTKVRQREKLRSNYETAVHKRKAQRTKW